MDLNKNIKKQISIQGEIWPFILFIQVIFKYLNLISLIFRTSEGGQIIIYGGSEDKQKDDIIRFDMQNKGFYKVKLTLKE